MNTWLSRRSLAAGFLFEFLLAGSGCGGEAVTDNGPRACQVVGQCGTGQSCIDGYCSDKPADAGITIAEGQSQVLFTDPMLFRDLEQNDAYTTEVSQFVLHTTWFMHGSPRVTYDESGVTVTMVTHPILPFETDRAKLDTAVSKVVNVRNGAVSVYDVKGLVYGARWLRDGQTYASVWQPGTSGLGNIALVHVESGQTLIAIPIETNSAQVAFAIESYVLASDESAFFDVIERSTGEALALLSARSYFLDCLEYDCSPYTMAAVATRDASGAWSAGKFVDGVNGFTQATVFSNAQEELGVAMFELGSDNGCDAKSVAGAPSPPLEGLVGLTPWVVNGDRRASIVRQGGFDTPTSTKPEQALELNPLSNFFYVPESYKSKDPVDCGLSASPHNAGRSLIRTKLGWVMPVLPDQHPPCNNSSAWGPVQFFAPHTSSSEPETLVDEIDTCNDYGLNPLMGTWVSFTGEDITYVELWGNEQGEFRVRYHQRPMHQ